jgi:sec-independent protein translocase protein TatB
MTPLLLDINGPEFLLLLVLAVILFGPERLPDLARTAARVVRYVGSLGGCAEVLVRLELGPGFEDLDLRDLNPKAFVQKHLLEDVEPIIADVKKEITDVGGTVRGSSNDVTAAINGAKDVSPGGPHDLMSDATPARVLTPFDAEAT